MLRLDFKLLGLMKVNKILNYVIITVIFALFTVTPVIAGGEEAEDIPQIPLETAINIAREKLDIPDNYYVSFSSFFPEIDGPRWHITFTDENKPEDKRISVSINTEDGIIREYMDGEYPSENQKKKISETQAKEIALKFLNKQMPLTYINTMFLTEDPWDDYSYLRTSYEFNLKRTINGYPFLNDSCRVVVDGVTGKVSNFELSWYVSNLPQDGEKPTIDYIKACEIFHEHVGLELGYVPVLDSASRNQFPSKAKLVLGYYPRVENISINGINGEVTLNYNSYVVKKQVKGYNYLFNENLPHDIKGPLSRGEAEEIARKFVQIPENYYLQGSYKGEGEWQFSWVPQNSYKEGISIRIDELNGEIREFNHWPTESGTKIEKARAKEIALEFIKKAIPTKLKLLADSENIIEGYDEISTQQSFYFPQVVNNLAIRSRGVSVTVNGDGNVTEFRSNLWTGTIPPVKDVISEADAKDVFDRRFIKNLAYVRGEYYQSKTILAYSTVQDPVYYDDYFIEATTGYYRNYDDIYFSDGQLIYAYLKHWAGKEINRLISMGVIDSEEKRFGPEKSLTRGELSKMLTRALKLNVYYPENVTFKDVRRTHSYFGYIEAVHARGIFKGVKENFKPEQTISREEMAVIITDIIKDTKQSKGKAPIIKDAKSISNTAKAGVIKAIKLGLMKCNFKGLFQPKTKITQAEVAVMLVKLIKLQRADELLLKETEF